MILSEMEELLLPIDMELTDISTESESLLLQSVVEESITPLVKHSLRNKIQQRRQSEGLDQLEVKFENPPDYQMRPEEIQKCELRKHRNRRSAHESRERRKQHEEKLKAEIKELEENNRKLSNYVTNLKTFERKLRLRFADHLIRCRSAADEARITVQEATPYIRLNTKSCTAANPLGISIGSSMGSNET